MSSSASFIFIFLFSFLTSFTAYAQTLSHVCLDRTTYSRNSTYSNNLQTLLSSLSSPNATYSTGFQNATAGQNTDRVTGLFLCRGDLSPEDCRTCVAFSVKEILIRCPNETQAVFYSDECMLRYSHENIFTSDGGVIIRNTQNVPPKQLDRFIDLVLSTMNQAANEAASNYKKFDARKVIWTSQQNLYGLVQCTPDLTREDCLWCLHLASISYLLTKLEEEFFIRAVVQDTSFMRSTTKPPLQNHHHKHISS